MQYWVVRAVAAGVLVPLLALPGSAQQFVANRSAVVVHFRDASADLAVVPASLRAPISLHLKDVSVERALDDIVSAGKLSLTYSRAVVPLDRVVSVDVDNASILEALRQALDGAKVELWISAEGTMALVPAPRAEQKRRAMNGVVSGRVTAQGTNEPVVGTLIIGSTRDWARGVQTWNLALDENAGPHTGGCGNCRGVVTINSTSGIVTRNIEYFALAHASRFVRPGAHRIASSTDVNGLQSVAFQNADDASKAIIVLNSGTVARRFAVHDGVSWFRYTLPAASVVTFSWK